MSAAQTIALAECVECGELTECGRCPTCHAYEESRRRRTARVAYTISPEARDWAHARARETGLPVDQIVDDALLAHITAGKVVAS